MVSLRVRIENLEPMHVAAFRATGDEPELAAWDKLRRWAEPRGLLAATARHPIFGFNNPAPTPERTEYGYEFWIEVDPETAADAEADVQDVPAGCYLVATHRGFPTPRSWMDLCEWARRNGFHIRSTHELERMLDPFAAPDEMVFDLYLPVEG